jgi:hypothetical protein
MVHTRAVRQVLVLMDDQLRGSVVVDRCQSPFRCCLECMSNAWKRLDLFIHNDLTATIVNATQLVDHLLVACGGTYPRLLRAMCCSLEYSTAM